MKCYLCQSQMSPFIHKNGYTIYRCGRCGLGHTDLKKDYQQFIKDYYNKGFFTGDPRRSAYISYQNDKPMIARNLKKFLSHIKKIKPGGSLLDVGCAFGYFVELALGEGYNAYGIDASAYAVAQAEKTLGDSRVREETASTLTFAPQSFDIITMFDVFEHLGDPATDLVKLTKLLKDDGVIVIATGDTQSLAARVFGRRWTFFIPPQHLFFFDRQNLTRLLGKVGLQPLSWFRVGKWLSLGYVLHLGRTTGESKLASLLYQRLGHTLLARFPLYIPMRDNMVVIAQKKL